MTQNIIFVNNANQSLLNSLTEECYVLDTSLNDDYCTQFINKAITQDKIILFYGENATHKAKYYKVNGILIDLGSTPCKEDMISLKKELGKNSIIGLISRNRRHEAMLNSELEPDFITFKVWSDGIENTKELLDWYNDFFIIQSALLLMDDNIDTSSLKADFIIKSI